MKAQDFVDAARSRIGVPFRHQGRGEHGLDCIGLVIASRLDLGPWDATSLDTADYLRNPGEALAVTADKVLIKIDKPEIGALALIRWPKMKHANHVGIITPTNIIHSYAQVGKVIETGYREPWVRQTVQLYRIPGMEQ